MTDREAISRMKELDAKATPPGWQADDFLCDGGHALRIGEPWKTGQPRATIAMVEHNWNDCDPHDRRISWKEAEANAALTVALRNDALRIITQQEDEIERLAKQRDLFRAFVMEAVDRIEKGDLDQRMCCDGLMCGCQGSTNADQFLHYARAALENRNDLP